MGQYHQQFALQRSLSFRNYSKSEIPSSNTHIFRSSSDSLIGILPQIEQNHRNNNKNNNSLIVTCPKCLFSTTPEPPSIFSGNNLLGKMFHLKLSSFLRFIISNVTKTIPRADCMRMLTVGGGTGRRVTGTLYGNRQGQVSFSVQHESRADPVLLLELGMSTANLVKEMASSGPVRIALECEKKIPAAGKIFQEPVWTMYCGGKKWGYAVSRRASRESDRRVLGTLSRVTIGAGVIPAAGKGTGDGLGSGELIYMRARFERVVGSRDSEAFYMLNPDKNGGPELTIFMLRI